MADELSDVLGPDLPPAVDALPESVRARLAAQIQRARRAQHSEIEEAIRVALRGVPLPLRGVIRKALLG